MTELWNRL